MAGIKTITVNGDMRTITPGSIAEDFSSAKSYVAGDYCYGLLGQLYRCTKDHQGVWNSSHFTEVTVGDELVRTLAEAKYEASSVKTSLTKSINAVATDLATEQTERASADATLTQSIEDLATDVADNYAQTDGYYDEMAVGSAEQLISTVTTEDKVPYIFRTSGGTADIGNRETDKIVGGTVSWNQLAKEFAVNKWVAVGSGASVSFSEGVATLTVTNAYNRIVMTPNISDNAHKIFYAIDFNTDFEGTFMFGVWSSSGDNNQSPRKAVNNVALNTWHELAGIGILEGGSKNQIMAQYNSGTGTVKLKNAQVIDLTQLFGSTIADYIYSLEQSTAGAGVAWFRRFFPKPYYEYNAGELKSVEGLSAHETVGFNQFEIADVETTKQGLTFTVNSDGSLNVKGTATGSSYLEIGTVDLLANQTYEICGCPSGGGSGKYGLALATEADYLLATDFGSGATYTPTENMTAKVIVRYWYGQNISITMLPCVHLRWSGYRDGEYEPYTKHSYPLDSSLVLRGIPKTDENGDLYYYGDTYESDGTVTRRFGEVDLGTLTWGYDSSGATPFFYVNGWNSIGKVNSVNFKVVGYTAKATFWGTAGNDKCVASGSTRLNMSNSAYTSASAFKTAMSGVYLVYELATPTTEQAEPYTNPQIVDDFGTEEYVTTGIVPVGHETQYMQNLRDKLQHLPDLADDDGVYVIQQTDSDMALVPLTTPTELPEAPSATGTYVLKATVTANGVTYAWVAG